MGGIEYPSEEKARRDIVEAGRRMYMRGYVCANDGNISARISETEILATPSGVSKGFMTEDMLVKLDLDGKPLDSKLKPSSEIRMHIAVYRENAELLSVCHAHPPIATAFAAAGVPLDKALLQETVMLLGVIPVAPYATPGSDELANGAAAFCRDYHGALLEHHGAVSWGRGVFEALYRLESIEYTATVTMYSKMMGFSHVLDNQRIAELVALRPNWGISAGLGNFNNE